MEHPSTSQTRACRPGVGGGSPASLWSQSETPGGNEAEESIHKKRGRSSSVNGVDGVTEREGSVTKGPRRIKRVTSRGKTGHYEGIRLHVAQIIK